MAVSLRNVFRVSASHEVVFERKEKAVGSPDALAWKNPQQFVIPHSLSDGWAPKAHSHSSIHAQASICTPQGLRWWEKINKANMIEMRTAQELVDSLLNAGDKLVIVGFYSPGCGGCKALHPKISQLAELYPNALFLQINYEQLKPVCESLHIHVLPFFRFYRGAQGRLCSFSCTIATVLNYAWRDAKENNSRGAVDQKMELLLCLTAQGGCARPYGGRIRRTGAGMLQVEESPDFF